MNQSVQQQELWTKTGTTCVVRVVVPLALPKILDYAWTEEYPPVVGQFVEAQVGKKAYHGLITETATTSLYKKLKPAIPLDIRPLPMPTYNFWRWAGRYTLSAPGSALRAALIAGKVPEKPAPTKKLVATGKKPVKITPQRQKVFDVIGDNLWENTKLAKKAGVSSAVIKKLVELGSLKWVETQESTPATNLNLVKLSDHQQQTAEALKKAAACEKFQPFVLDGVTGSGKTEVYFEIIAHILEKTAGQVLVLVPEISLTPQWLQRFKERFGFQPAIWHSSITPATRKRTWHQVLNGTARIIIGARSSLFLPYHDLKFIVVDEEQDSSYKQEDDFRYHGRDMAVSLANHWKCPVVLASATPSLETWHNMKQARYAQLLLPSRYGDAQMAEIKLIDMRKHKPQQKDRWLSPLLINAINETIARKEQVLLFLNRRGTAPLMLCRACGHRIDCPSCDASLIVHGNRLICHHCGFMESTPETCPKCDKNTLYAFGPGTRKIAQEVHEIFPNARFAVADSDAIGTTSQMGELVETVEKGHIDILIGTQMITKGHHFPNLTLVGILDGDMGLAHGDLRAAERTFQLLMQVSGRAGREKPGNVYLQTYQPDHPLYQTLITHDRDKFYALELQNRRQWGDPPFSRMIALILTGSHEQEIMQTGQKLIQNMPKNTIEAHVLGPAPAPLSRLKDRYRYRLLVKALKSPQAFVQDWLAQVPIPARVRVDIDVDPVSFS